MSRLSDYLRDVFNTGFADQDVERLFAGSTPCDRELAELTDFVQALRTYRTIAPTNVATVPAAELAAIAAESRSAGRPALDPQARVPRPDRRQLVSHRVAIAAVFLIFLMGFSGVAIAANGAAPGDTLYGLDRALERIGIGAGSADERIAEADALIARGADEAALDLLADSLIVAEVDLDETAIRKIERHLELAEKMTNSKASDVQERVAEKKQFIEENKGNGNGVDGEEFGQGVSDIAKDDNPSPTTPTESSDSPDPEPGPPDNAGPKEGKGNAPDHAGPKGKPEK